MGSIQSFAGYGSRLREFIAHSKSEDSAFNELALDLFALQFAQVEPYRRLCESRRVTPRDISGWKEIPCVASAAFKELELSSIPIAGRTTEFHSSGTTGQQPGRHFHNAESLAIYESSLLSWFKTHLLADTSQFTFIMLTPPQSLASRSSLVHMLAIVRREFGSPDSLFTGSTDATGAWLVDMNTTLRALLESVGRRRPVALLGTAFSFVHLLDQMAALRLDFALPAGSRVMETGGYKGRSRHLPRTELHALITRHLGIPGPHIVCEYGMSELSSQAYDGVGGRPLSDPSASSCQRIFRFPPWARARIVSPETGREVGEGETGLIQVYDLANVRSVMAVQTEDLGVRRGAGFEVIGRAGPAEPRGCSLLNT